MAALVLILCAIAFGYLVALANELTLPPSRRILMRPRRSRFREWRR